LRVQASFPGNASGTTEIIVPTNWAGARGADRGIRNLVVLTSGAQLREGSERGRMLIAHQMDEPVRIAYDLVPIPVSDSGATGGQNYLPQIDDAHVHLIGWTAWVLPMMANRSNLTATLRITNIPQDWQVATSFGVGRSTFTFPWRLMDFARSIIVMGDYRLTSMPVGAGGSHLRLAVRGRWSTSDAQLSERLQRMMRGLHNFWRDVPDDYLVVLSPLPSNEKASRQGTALLNGFVSFASDDVRLPQLETLWTHETLHRWIRSAASPGDYWFSEGFTDYYTYYLRVGLGLAQATEFVAEANDALSVLATLSARNQDNASATKQFHVDAQATRLPYRRGFLLAAHWDSAIRVRSNGKYTLGDAMRALLVEGEAVSAKLTRERIENVMRHYGVAGVSTDIENYAIQGKLINLNVSAFAPCIATESMLPLGFDYDETSKRGVISGLDKGSAAAAAGLLDGMKIVELPPLKDSPGTSYALRVKSDDVERTIKFPVPAPGSGSERLIRVGDVEACAAVFGR
jgi:predicted metalloprotease with PDZ domain